MSDRGITIADLPDVPENPAALRVRSYWQTVRYRLRYDYVTLFFLAVLALVLMTALLAPELAPFDPTKTSTINRMKPIGYRDFLPGTDELGRDMLSRLLWGGRASLTMGCGPVALATLIGGFLGIVAGFIGGPVKIRLQRVFDGFFALPPPPPPLAPSAPPPPG